jgi:RES domain
VGVAARVFGLDQRIGTSTDYALCQEWAQAFYDSYPEIRGIRWRGRQAGSICAVLNDRAGRGSLEAITDCAISHPDVWPQISRAARRARLRIVA